MPSYIGSVNWGGVEFQAEKQIAVVRVIDIANVIQLIKREDFEEESQSGKHPDSQYSTQRGTP
ncbi:MAG: quinoprotein glucose dehydrogenase [Candidatus Azotimanducaceae bacterium]|jgi:quinoprotein glucose dehydrogenase